MLVFNSLDNIMMGRFILLFVSASYMVENIAAQDCIASPEFSVIPEEGSCCMEAVCALPCPETVPDPGKGKNYIPFFMS